MLTDQGDTGKICQDTLIFASPCFKFASAPTFCDKTVPMSSGTEDKWLPTKPKSAIEFCDIVALIKHYNIIDR